MAEAGANSVGVFECATGEDTRDVVGDFDRDIIGREELLGEFTGSGKSGGMVCFDVLGESGAREDGELVEFVAEGAEVEDALGSEDDRLVAVVGIEDGH